jgi:hypothetical protein
VRDKKSANFSSLDNYISVPDDRQTNCCRHRELLQRPDFFYNDPRQCQSFFIAPLASTGSEKEGYR